MLVILIMHPSHKAKKLGHKMKNAKNVNTADFSQTICKQGDYFINLTLNITYNAAKKRRD